MIILWFKIIGYKAIKLLKRADTGTVTGSSRARHEISRETSPGSKIYRRAHDGRVTKTVDGYGIVHKPERSSTEGLMKRIPPLSPEALAEIKASYWSGSDHVKPCGCRIGTGFTEDCSQCLDALMEVRPCYVCRAPDHAGVMHGESYSGPRESHGITWPCMAGQCPEWAVCDDAGHCVEEIQSPVRPSDEIESCPRCGHPQHYGIGAPAVCGYPSASIEGRTLCSCTAQEVKMP